MTPEEKIKQYEVVNNWFLGCIYFRMLFGKTNWTFDLTEDRYLTSFFNIGCVELPGVPYRLWMFNIYNVLFEFAFYTGTSEDE